MPSVDPIPEEFADLARQFNRFATLDVLKEVPLYQEISRIVAADPSLLALAAHAAPGQPPPNLLFAAVRFQLNRTPEDPLFQTYRNPSFHCDELTAQFREFCHRNADHLAILLAERKVQTNEVGRAALLLPAYLEVARRNAGRSFHLVEIGTSAGLNLIYDRYRIAFSGWHTFGPIHSPVLLRTELRGTGRPPSDTGLPVPLSRIGLDLNPLDCTRQDDRDWLEALIWPGQTVRAERLKAACDLAATTDLDLRAGDALELLPATLSGLPAGEPVVLSHSWVFSQFSQAEQQRLHAILSEAGAGRPLSRVGLEWAPDAESEITLTDYDLDRKSRRLATCHPHGRWLHWVA